MWLLFSWFHSFCVVCSFHWPQNCYDCNCVHLHVAKRWCVCFRGGYWTTLQQFFTLVLKFLLYLTVLHFHYSHPSHSLSFHLYISLISLVLCFPLAGASPGRNCRGETSLFSVVVSLVEAVSQTALPTLQSASLWTHQRAQIVIVVQRK